MSASPPESVKNPLMPLSMVDTGKSVRLVAVQAGRGLAQRLAEMGFVPGVEIELVNNGAGGPVVVLIKGSRLALGRGMAQKIMVR